MKKTGDVQTIEQTSKRCKAQILASLACVGCGLLALLLAFEAGGESVWEPIGAFLLVAGGGWYVAVKVMIWWYHG